VKQEVKQEREDLMSSQHEELKTVREIAQHYRVDDTTVRRWIKNGVLEAITLPNRGRRKAYRVKPSAIRTFDKDYQG
jgi:excisionase family DNA binding protein